MTQSSTLGVQPAAIGLTIRLGWNKSDEAIVTDNEGPIAPEPTYPFMIWRDTSSGKLRQRSSANSAWETIERFSANIDPTITADSSVGYVRGSLWINTSTNKIFHCIDPTIGAAKWRIVAPGVPSVFTRTGAVTQSSGDYTTDKISDDTAHVMMLASERTELARVISIKDFGAKGDGVTNDTTAFTNAATYVIANGSSLWIPAGTYIIKQQISFTNTRTSIFGDGINTTELRWPSDATTHGLLLSSSDSKKPHVVRDITFSTEKRDVGDALTLDYSGQIVDLGGGEMTTVDRVSPRALVQNCFFAGTTVVDSGDAFSTGWRTGVKIIAAVGAKITNCTFVGVASTQYSALTTVSGFVFEGSPANSNQNGHPTFMAVTDSTIWYAETGISFTNCSQYYMKGCTITACNTGIKGLSTNSLFPSGDVNISETHISTWQYGIVIQLQNFISITGCLIYGIQTSTNYVAILLINSSIFSLTRNTFAPLGANMNCIVVQDSSYGSIGNNCFQQGSNFIASCIWLQGGAHHCTGAKNIYAGTFNFTVLNQGTFNTVT